MKMIVSAVGCHASEADARIAPKHHITSVMIAVQRYPVMSYTSIRQVMNSYAVHVCWQSWIKLKICPSMMAPIFLIERRYTV